MSTVAYKDGIMVADSYCEVNGLLTRYYKLRKTKNTLFGIVGHPVALEPMSDWFNEGADIDKIPACIKTDGEVDFELLIVTRAEPEAIYRVLRDGFVEQWSYDAWAIGSGAGLAVGALDQGASAIEAVKIAAKFDKNTGGRICSIKV